MLPGVMLNNKTTSDTSINIPSKDTLYSLQALRAIAAAMVVAFHSFVHLDARGIIDGIPAIVDAGRAGVDIFFVISGFIMVYISKDNFGKPGAPTDFLIRRIIRVVPVYWFYTFLIAAILFAVPHLFSQGKSFDLDHLIASLLFIPWQNSIGDIKPILNVGWTLNFEMYFYCIFAITLLLGKRYFLPIMSIVMLCGAAAGLTGGPYPTLLNVITSPMLLEFLAGCLIGSGYIRRFATPKYFGVVLLIAGASLLILSAIFGVIDAPRVIKWGIPSVLIVTGALLVERSGIASFPSLLVKLGGSSYSLYLSHIFTISAIGKLWVTIFGSMYGTFIVVATASSILVGHLSYVIVEKPMTRYLNNIYRNKLRARIVGFNYLR